MKFVTSAKSNLISAITEVPEALSRRQYQPGDNDESGVSKIFTSMLVGQMVSFGMLTQQQLVDLLAELKG